MRSYASRIRSVSPKLRQQHQITIKSAPYWFTRSFPRCLSSSFSTTSTPTSIKIVEVGPRDGLQNEPTFIPTDKKIQFISKLIQAGCKNVEVTSFVSPKAIPALADHDQVMREVVSQWKGGGNDELLRLSSLVPNVRGFENACKAGTDEVAIFGSVSESFSKKNINCSVEESIGRFRSVSIASKEKNIPLRGYISCVLGCPYEGYIKPSAVAKYAEQLLELGCHEISLGDTIGVGTPKATVEMLREVKTVVDTNKIAVHFHDTYGQALANIYASITEESISVVDSSIAGLGGCPYAKGASGNVATEDVIYMLHGMGIQTRIDLDKLIEAGSYISDVLGRPTRSKVALALSAKEGNR